MKRAVRQDPLGDRLNNAPTSSIVDATDELMAYKQGGAVAPPPQVIEVPALALDGNVIPAGNFRLTPVGLEVVEGATFDEWYKLGEAIMQIESSMQWVQGDWAQIALDQHWNVSVEELAKRFNKEVDSLWTYASICRGIPTIIRNYSPTFSHAALVQGLTEQQQEYWLRLAQDNRWRVQDLRRELKLWREANDPNRKALPNPVVRAELVERQNKLAFNRVWTALKRGRKPKREDIAFIRQWLDSVEQDLKG